MPTHPTPTTETDVLVIGGGQSALATAYYLRRAGLRPGTDFLVLDAADQPGGAWARMWPGLRTFSPASFSSLPGWMMPAWDEVALGYPPRQHVVDYLTRYEERYDLQVLRNRRVLAVDRREDERLMVSTATEQYAAVAVVSATGTWERPFWPTYPGAQEFGGRQLHAADYRTPDEFAGQHVVIVGGGNSAAQILAEVSTAATTTWVTQRPPRFLADDIDGRALFAAARQRIHALAEGREHPGVGGLGDIVMVESVRAARARGVLAARPAFKRLTADGVVWSDGSAQRADAVIWCTGFRPALRHLAPLRLTNEDSHPRVGGPAGTTALDEPRLHLVGYGDWVGPASATLAGIGPSARTTAQLVVTQVSTGS